jgi:zinc transport system substrate-binding protein
VKRRRLVRKTSIIIIGVLILSLMVNILLGGCSSEDSSKLKVVTSTSLMSQIVERVGGDKVSVINIIPPAQCPGHFDIKPGDIQKLADARLFFIHNWQGEQFSDELIASANNENLTTVIVEIAGNWMTPPVQEQATEKIAAALAEADPDNRAVYEKAATEYKNIVAAKETEIKAKLEDANLSGINVLCDEQQTGFVKWTGLNVISTYGRPETLTIQVKKELVDTGKANNVSLVIDNMQTGGEAGKSLAEELGVKHIVLSNFPGGYDNTETWEKAIDKNIDLILSAIGN